MVKSRPLNEKYLNEAEACKIMHCCPRILTQLRADKKIPFMKSHRKILFLASDIDEYLERKFKAVGRPDPNMLLK